MLKKAAPELIQQLKTQQRLHTQISIIKELLENSIDSGADCIKICIDSKTQGVDYIKVEDNGCGIEASELKNVFLENFTSKNENEKFTYGNHGLAIYSIASIAEKVVILSKTKEEKIGYKMSSEDLIQKPSARKTGTDVEIYNIFDNLPVRRKSLLSKSNQLQFKNRLKQLIDTYLFVNHNKNFFVQVIEKENPRNIIYNSKNTKFPNLTTIENDNSLKIDYSLQSSSSSSSSKKFNLIINKRPIYSSTKKLHPVVKLLRKYDVTTGFICITVKNKDLDFNIEPSKSWVLIPDDVLHEIDDLFDKYLVKIKDDSPIKITALVGPKTPERKEKRKLETEEESSSGFVEERSTKKLKPPPSKKTYRASDIDIELVKSVKPLPDGIKSYPIKHYIGMLPKNFIKIGVTENDELVATDGEKVEKILDDIKKL